MKDKSKNTISVGGFGEYRGVSQIIAVALLILVAVGFVVAIEEVGTNFLGSVEQPPSANVEADTGEEELTLTVQSVSNADKLNVTYQSDELYDNSGSGDALDGSLSANAGSVATVNYKNVNGLEVDDQIIVTGTDLPDNTAVVFRYTIPNGTDLD